MNYVFNYLSQLEYILSEVAAACPKPRIVPGAAHYILIVPAQYILSELMNLF